MFKIEIAGERRIFGVTVTDYAIVNSKRQEVARIYGEEFGTEAGAIAQLVADTLNQAVQKQEAL